jgi:ASC-1-like (ASCH) protein
MSLIKKKINHKYFNLVKLGKKKFELRLADFKIKPGDILILQEWNPKTKKYTGRELKKKVNFILKFKLNDFGQAQEIKKKGLYVIQF